MEDAKLNRRQVAIGLTALGMMNHSDAAPGDMPRRPLGKTGEKVSALGVGGSHIGEAKVGERDAIGIIRGALDGGINFLDNCWDYHEGQSELRMGKALRDGYRRKAFVMSKIDGRTRQSAAKQIDESLKRLGVDHIDLMQHHEIIRFDDPDRIFAPGGANEALLEAKKAGKIRFIGFTGHKDPHIHLYMLKTADAHGFTFDAVQMPLNVMDAHFRSFEKMVLPELVKRNIGVLGMKSIGAGVILKSKAVDAVECLRYALSLPTSTVITGIDSMARLEQALNVLRTFKPLAKAEVASMLSRTAPLAARGEYELFKTTEHYDGTARNPQWLGPENPRVKQLTDS